VLQRYALCRKDTSIHWHDAVFLAMAGTVLCLLRVYDVVGGIGKLSSGYSEKRMSHHIVEFKDVHYTTLTEPRR